MLRIARRRAGLTQRALAAKAGVPQPTISRIERDVVSPSVSTLEPLIRACGMELEVVERPGSGVDRTLIAEHLKLTPGQRARLAAKAANELSRIRRVARKAP
jgi:transcriptional regulator with XRE-family HTH domain